MRIYHKTAMKLWYYRNHRGSTMKNSDTTPSSNRTSYYEPTTNQTLKPAYPSVQPTVSVNKSNSSGITLEPFDLMTGVKFKDLLENYFKKNGYTVNRISPQTNRIDFLIEKDNIITAVASKKTFDLIQKSYVNNVIISAKIYENVSSIMIITTSIYFMPQARQLAEKNGIILWDREILKSQLGGSK